MSRFRWTSSTRTEDERLADMPGRAGRWEPKRFGDECSSSGFQGFDTRTIKGVAYATLEGDRHIWRTKNESGAAFVARVANQSPSGACLRPILIDPEKDQLFPK